MSASFENSKEYQEVLRFRFPRYCQLPQLELYMDQVLCVVNQHLALFAAKGEKLLTAAMVNNYVKKKLLPPAVGKRYPPGHIAHLLCICTLKPVLSISEIEALLALECQCQQQAYDAFGELVEQALCSVFACGRKDASLLPSYPAGRPVQAAILSFANKLYLQKYLAFQAGQASPCPRPFKEEKAPSPRKKTKTEA